MYALLSLRQVAGRAFAGPDQGNKKQLEGES
jgi:hypothetical protein